jgi:isopentenyldiphosphate isomerase
MERLCAVTQSDKLLGAADYDEVYKKKIRHRVVHLFLFSNNRILLQKRCSKCKYKPNHWSSSCQGHVRYGESYIKAAKRECKEELNLVVRPKFITKVSYKSDINKIIGICVAFKKDIKLINTKDITTTKLIPLLEMQHFLKRKKTHPELCFLIKRLDFQKIKLEKK